MNKKALYESIMKHVAKEVKKALNEEKFSNWRLKYPEKQTNTSVFDFDKFKKCLFDVVVACKWLCADGQINIVELISPNECIVFDGAYRPCLEGAGSAKHFVERCMERLQQLYSNKSEQAKILEKSYFNIEAISKSAFESYLKSQKTSNDRLKDFNYGKISINLGIAGLQFTVTEIMEHSQEIKDFLEQ